VIGFDKVFLQGVAFLAVLPALVPARGPARRAATSRSRWSNRITTARHHHPRPAPPAASARRRAYIILATVAVLAVAGWQTWRWWTHGKITTDDAQIEADIVPIAARVAGTVQAVPVHDHQRVDRNTTLVEIDPRDLEVRVHQADAELEAARAEADAADAQVRVVSSSSSGGLSTARAQLTGAGAAVRTADAEVRAAEAAVSRARTGLTQADTELARTRQLVERGAITRSELDAAQASRDGIHSLTVPRPTPPPASSAARQLAVAGRRPGRGSCRSPIGSPAAGQRPPPRLGQVGEVRSRRRGSHDHTYRAPSAAPVESRSTRARAQVGRPSPCSSAQTFVVANFKGRCRASAAATGRHRTTPPTVFHGRREHRRTTSGRLAAQGDNHRQLRQGGAAGAGAHRLGSAGRARHAPRPLGRGHRARALASGHS
jgi:hypothetical protein